MAEVKGPMVLCRARMCLRYFSYMHDTLPDIIKQRICVFDTTMAVRAINSAEYCSCDEIQLQHALAEHCIRRHYTITLAKDIHRGPDIHSKLVSCGPNVVRVYDCTSHANMQKTDDKRK